MKTLIISDTHLHTTFRVKKYKFLVEVISKADRVILNGDFWDSYYTDFDGFLKSKWKGLFPFLKERDTVYLYGNHDLDTDVDERTNLFSNFQGYEYQLIWGEKTLQIQHGHLLDDTFKDNHPTISRVRPILRWLARISYIFEYIDVRILRSWARKIKNERVKDLYRTKLAENDVLVFGHTHYAENDLENGYLNSGFVKHGIGTYLMIEEENITLYKEKY